MMDIEKPLLRRPAIFGRFPGLSAGESTRHGGVSAPPFASLNLGKSTDDNLEHVAENRRRFCNTLGFDPNQMAFSYQVHGDQVRLVTEAGGADGYDALITQVPGVLLAVSIADCTPILIVDPVTKGIAAIHAGWRGTEAQIARKTMEAMQAAFGTRPETCWDYVGTCIDECSFEVGQDVADHFDAAFKQYNADTDRFLVDLKKANCAQLQFCGIPAAQIETSAYSTVLHVEDYFSHRKEKGQTGRMLCAIGWKQTAQ